MSGVDPSSLLDADGKIDPEQVRALALDARRVKATKVDAEQATYIRQQLLRGRTLKSLSDELELCRRTVSRHAREPDDDVYPDDDPDCPPVEFVGSEWRYVDD